MPKTFVNPGNYPLTVLCLCLTALSATVAGSLLAQSDSPTDFREKQPPPGLVKGYMKSGDRWGALLKGGKTVYRTTERLLSH